MGLEIGSLTRLPLGYVGESGTRMIEIHVSSWLKEFPGSKIVVEVVRPDKKIYFASTTLENGILRWTVGADEVMVAGRGYAQFAVVNVNTNKEYRSRIVETIIAPSLEEFTKEELEASDPAKKWANQVIAAASAVQDVTGDLRNLNTQNKSNLVAAINEVRATGGGGSSGGTTIIGATIADGPVSKSSVWSSYYTNEMLAGIENRMSEVIDNAVRFDEDQHLDTTQQEQARKNIGITSTGTDVSSLIDNYNIRTDRAWSSSTTNNAIGDLGQSLIGDIGQKSGLITDTNADLVMAINEVKQNVLDLAAGETISAPPIIEAWGDSLTYGAGADNYDSSAAYPAVLSGNNYIGKVVVNYGAGGETIETIMGRMGAMPLVVMPTSTTGDGSSGGDSGGDSGGTSTSLGIIKQPTSTKADVGKIVSFAVVANGVASYQWQYGTDIDGWLDFDVNTVTTACDATLLLTVNEERYGYNYRCVLTDANGNTLTTDTVRIYRTSEFVNINHWKNQTPYTNPTTGLAAELTTYASGGFFQFDSSVNAQYYCYLFSAEVEAGKTYLFTNKNLQLDEWVITNVNYIVFTSEAPYSYNSNANAAMFKVTEVGTSLQNCRSPFTVPSGANYVSFLFSKKLYGDLAAADWPMTLQEINDEHPGPSDTVDMSTVSTLSVQERDSGGSGVLVIPGEVRKTLLAGGIKSITGADTTLLKQPGREADGINPCFIDGVEGTLTRENGSYYFTRSFNGTPVSIIKPTPIITHYMRTVSNNRILLLWLGQNNATSADSTFNIDDLAQRMIDAHKAIIDHVGTNKYIILGAPINQPVANSAEVYKPLYERMQYAFGKHYINIADYLIEYAMSNYGIGDKSGFVGTEKVWTSDAEDRLAYRVPTSLRGVTRNDDGTVKAPDSVHLNSKGYLAVADQVYKRGKELGYW